MGCGASAEVEKKGFVYRVRLLGGLNLYNNGFGVQIPGGKTQASRFEGKSDPFAILESTGCDAKHKSEVVRNEQNPVWNEEFYFSCTTKEPVLSIIIKDYEYVTGDDTIGKVSIPLHGLIGRDKEREIWVPLEGAVAKGEVGISVIECYRMQVTAKSGKGVEPMDTLSGTSDCYMTLQVGQQERVQTSVKGWTTSPVWNESFTFFVPYGIKSQLEMILWDRDHVGVNMNMGWRYLQMDGKPDETATEPRVFETEITNAKGTLTFHLKDDVTLTDVPEAGPVTDEMKKAFPLEAPGTCTFECRVLGAYNLAAGDSNGVADLINSATNDIYHEYKEYTGTSDPFARVTCEGTTYDTEHINNTLEPIWNEPFRFVCRDREESKIDIQLWDHDLIADDCIGRVQLPLNTLKPGQRQEIWSFLDCGRGEVGIELTQHTQIRVRVESASGLPAKDLNGMCDPYVQLKLAGTTYKTRVCRDNREPWFEEDFRFIIPTLDNVKLEIEINDSDLMLFKQNLSEDRIGNCEVDLSNLVPGIPNEMEIDVMHGNQPAGKLKLVITNEVPLPESVLGMLGDLGKEAFEAAAKKLNEATEMVKCMKLPDFDNKEEAEYAVADPKMAARPRFSRINVEVVAVRGLVDCTSPMYVGVSVPSQGSRQKTKTEYKNPKHNDINESFQFNVPSRETGAIEVCIFESNKHSYTGAWSSSCHSKIVKPFSTFNDNDGLVRGAAGDYEWIDLPDGKGQVVIRVTEMFRYQIRVLEGDNLSCKADPYVIVNMGGQNHWTSIVDNDPVKTRTTGVPGKPKWNEQFTYFVAEKGPITFRLMDDTIGSDTQLGLGTFDIAECRRGVPHKATIELDTGGQLLIEVMEEEKMSLLDRIIDAAGNIARLAAGLAEEVADAAKDAVSNVAGAIGGALGGLGKMF